MAKYGQCSINSAPDGTDEESTPLLARVGEEPAPPQCCSVRCGLANLMFLGFAVVYALRVNLSVAMVAMVNGTSGQPMSNHSSAEECPTHASTNDSSSMEQLAGVPQYPWDSDTQGLLLAAFFSGYLFTQVPGGYLAGRLGGRYFLGGGVLGTALLTLLTPSAASLGVPWLFTLRALEGFGEGVTYPAMMALWACWAPPLERSRLVSLAGAGGNFGAFVALPLTGAICHSLGWPAVFYCCGTDTLTLTIILVSDDPRSHPRISERERDYIITSIGKQGGSHGWSVPVGSMLRSVPLWSIVVAQVCSNWTYYTLLTCLPTYMDNILHFNIRESGLLSALPYLGGWFCSVLSGVVADCLLERKLLGVTAVRKIFTLTGTEGLLLPGMFLVGVSFVGCAGGLAVLCLTVSSSLSGTSAAGVFINQLDIAPRYAGMLLGITNTFGTIPGIVAPIVVGHLTKQRTMAEWRTVFCLSAAISAVGALVFTVFGTGEPQSWALQDTETDTRGDTETDAKEERRVR
ncbi:S17A5 protein, partial [Amia calva]|nr:S17A5 protein [Amia calva]